MEAMSAFSPRLVSRSVLVGAGAVVLTAGSALAGTGAPDVDMTLDWNGGQGFSIQYDLINDSDSWTIQGDELIMVGSDTDNSTWRLNWEARTRAPGSRGGSEFVVANLQVFNDTLATQTYWILQSKNGINVGPNTDTSGTVSATVFDLSNNDATMQNISTGSFAGDPIYEARIDGVAHETMWNNGFNLTATAAQFSASDDDAFNNVPGSGVNDSIAVWLKFEVTPLDSVNIIGYFEVNPVPAPATLPALAVLGLLGGRRRRH